VIVYGTDCEIPGRAPHIRQRNFTRRVRAHSQDRRLARVTPGPDSGPDRTIFHLRAHCPPCTLTAVSPAARGVDRQRRCKVLLPKVLE
jgi:hypothetical protein